MSCNEVSGTNSSRTVGSRMTECYADIRTDILFSIAGNDVARYFLLEVIVTKHGKCHLDDLEAIFSGMVQSRIRKF